MTDSAENFSLTIEDATYLVRDGLVLLECVDGVDDSLASRGILQVHAENGKFTVDLDIANSNSAASLREANGGVWGEHPDHPAEDWRIEVENHDTRAGYWDWVAGRIEALADDSATEPDGSVDYSRDYSLDRPTY